METAIFTAAICMLLLGKPRLRYTLPADGSYMSHDRTMMINGIFLVIIVLKHLCQNGYVPQGPDIWLRDSFIYPLFQFIVATFFFYSGYGIMASIRKKGDAYIHDLLGKRFLRLYLNFAVAAFISCAAMATFYMAPMAAAEKFALSMVGMGGWWFIVMTLALYLLTWASFRLCGTQRPWCAIVLLAVLTLALCIALFPYKEQWWVDTELCFPAGAAYFILQPRTDALLARTRLPISLIGAGVTALAIVGLSHLLHLNYYVSYLLQLEPEINIPLRKVLLTQALAIVFAVGVTWFFAGISWQRVPRFLKWFGGTAVFAVFLWHFIPIRLSCHLGLNTACPPLHVLAVFLSAILLAWLGIRLFNFIDRLFWKD
ncbi:MAG: acyltransferase family protein [Akkermansia sp.]|nr:acyltransferase family protein [Akkermansia sp.]